MGEVIVLTATADVATRQDGIAAGGGPHLPVGYWSGEKFRSAIRFDEPPGWDAWLSITKATLYLNVSDHAHVGVRNSSIYVRRTVSGSPWTKSEGSQSCNDGFSGGNTTQYSDLDPASDDQVSFSTGTTANAGKVIVVTDIVRAYWGLSQKPVFILDPVGSGDYSEFWSENTTPGLLYEPQLKIEYEVQTVPLAPTLGSPAADATVADDTPTLSWTHNDPDPQTDAEVLFHDPLGGPADYTWHPASPADEFLTVPITLVRGVTYTWSVRTADATGFGPWSATRDFTVEHLPVVVVSSTRRMVFANGAPRLVVQWTSDKPQTHYRVQSSAGYDSGWVAGSDTSHTLSTQAVVSGTAQTITVSSRDSSALEGSDSEVFTPRYGLTTHRRDLTSAPLNWGSPVIVSTVPADCQLVIEYGSDVAAIAAPSAWFSALSAVPKKRYLFWRAWFIPSATLGPTLDTITIPVDATVTAVDKWGTTRDVATLVAPWGVDPGEAVYGTRSMTIDCDGTAQKAYSFGIKVRAGRSYILTGLMKSQGDSGAHFRLEDAAGVVLQGGGMVLPFGDVKSEVLAATRDWFDTAQRDTHRYRTVVWVAPADMTVYVVLGAQGVSGAKAWWDAIKLEESTVATPWSPGAIGATVVDAGGVQIDATRGGVFRYRGSTGGARDVVSGGPSGLLFAGDTELTSPSDGVLAIDGVPISGGGASGTSFPGSPATNTRFFRTDYAMEFYYDGTRWRSTQVFEAFGASFGQGVYAVNLTATQAAVARASMWGAGGTDIWLTDVSAGGFIVAGSSALSAAHKWVGTVSKVAVDNTPTLVATINIDSGASGAWRWATAAVGALLGTVAAFPTFILDWTKTGTPGALNAPAVAAFRVRYRLVAT